MPLRLAGTLASLAGSDPYFEHMKTDIAAMRGVMESGPSQDDPAPLRAALLADVTAVLTAFDDMRLREGTALHDVLMANERYAACLKVGAAAASSTCHAWHKPNTSYTLPVYIERTLCAHLKGTGPVADSAKSRGGVVAVTLFCVPFTGSAAAGCPAASEAPGAGVQPAGTSMKESGLRPAAPRPAFRRCSSPSNAAFAVAKL